MEKQGRIHRNNRGFSLMELLVVVGLIGIISLVAFPMISRTIPKYRLRSVVRQLVIDFKQARLEAVKRNRDVLIVFTPETTASEGGSYQVCADADEDDTCDSGEVLKTVTMPKQVLLYTTNFGGDDTGYDFRGIPLETGRVEIRDSGDTHRYALVVGSAGSVRLESSTDGGTTWSAY